jgi:hypothetical protein
MRTFYILVLTSLLLFSCKSSEELYKKGEYESAFKKALSKLSKSDENQGPQESILNKSFAKLYQKVNSKYNYLMKDKNIGDAEVFYREADRFYDLTRDGSRFLNNQNDKDLNQATQYKDEVKRYIIDVYAADAMNLLEKSRSNGDKFAAQRAYEIYQNIIGRNYGTYMRAEMEEAERLGTFWYNFELDYGFNLWFSTNMDRQFDNIIGRSTVGRKVTYKRLGEGVDCNFIVRFGNLQENKNRNNNTQTYNQDIIDGYKTEKDKNGKDVTVPIYKKVTATVTTETERITYAFSIDVDVQGRTRFCTLSDDRFTVENFSEIVSHSYNGDIKALPQQIQAEILNPNNRHKYKDDLVNDLIRQVYERVSRSYF